MLLDNRNSGQVATELKKRNFKGSKLSVLSNLFSIYGFSVLRKELNSLTESRVLLTGWQSQTLQSLIGSESELRLINKLNQRAIAKECSKWISDKVQVRADGESQQSGQNLIHLLSNGGDDHFAVHGSATLTPTGLGEVRSSSLQMNTGISDA